LIAGGLGTLPIWADKSNQRNRIVKNKVFMTRMWQYESKNNRIFTFQTQLKPKYLPAARFSPHFLIGGPIIVGLFSIKKIPSGLIISPKKAVIYCLKEQSGEIRPHFI
jgi:hypothetical protein